MFAKQLPLAVMLLAVAALAACSPSDAPTANPPASSVATITTDTPSASGERPAPETEPGVDPAALVVERHADCLTALGVDPATAESTPAQEGDLLIVFVSFAGPPALTFRVPLQPGNFTVPADDATIAALGQVGC